MSLFCHPNAARGPGAVFCTPSRDTKSRTPRKSKFHRLLAHPRSSRVFDVPNLGVSFYSGYPCGSFKGTPKGVQNKTNFGVSLFGKFQRDLSSSRSRKRWLMCRRPCRSRNGPPLKSGEAVPLTQIGWNLHSISEKPTTPPPENIFNLELACNCNTHFPSSRAKKGNKTLEVPLNWSEESSGPQEVNLLNVSCRGAKWSSSIHCTWSTFNPDPAVGMEEALQMLGYTTYWCRNSSSHGCFLF